MNNKLEIIQKIETLNKFNKKNWSIPTLKKLSYISVFITKNYLENYDQETFSKLTLTELCKKTNLKRRNFGRFFEYLGLRNWTNFKYFIESFNSEKNKK